MLQSAKRDISETQLPYVLMCLVEMPACTFLGFFRLVARRERLDDCDGFIAFFLIARTRAAVTLPVRFSAGRSVPDKAPGPRRCGPC